MKKHWLATSSVGAIVVIFVVICLALWSSRVFNDCMALSDAFTLRTLSWCAGEYVEANEGSLVAIGTLLVGLFTAVLSVATVLLWRTTHASIELARQEFVSTHRPRIIVRSFERVTDANHPDFHYCIATYVNAGNTPAKIAEIAAKITPPDKGVLRPGLGIPVLGGEIADDLIASGEEKTKLITSEIVVAHNDINKPDHKVYCVGYITYHDELGRKRRTGFCRRYDPNTKTWVREDNAEYEYAY